MTERQSEALEKLNRGIRESRQEIQERTMKLAQDYFSDSADALKEQIKESRATLESLPDQIPGGREEAFQALFEELMDNYSSMEECINEAQQKVAGLDTDKIRRLGEIDATDAAKREARERGIDLTKIEGTGADGRIIVSDVVEAAQAMEAEAEVSEDGAASEAAGQAQDAASRAVGQTGQAVGQAADEAGEVASRGRDAAGRATDQAQEAAGQVAGGAQDVAGEATGQVSGVLGGVSDQVGQAVEQAQETAGGTVRQAQETAGRATDQAADRATGGDGDDEPRATNAARRRAEELGIDLSQVRGTGSGGLITLRDVTGS